MSAPNPSTALARVLVDELARCGVTDAVLAPGSRSTPLALALHAHSGVRLHVEIDERSAAFLALGLAKVSARPAVVVTTSGTATVNLHPGVVEAHASRTPLLVLTADRPPELRHTAANQTIDQIKLYSDSVRWFAEVGVPEARADAVAYWRSLADQAYARTVGSPPGPVHLNLAFREPLVPDESGEAFPYALDGRPRAAPWTAWSAPRTAVSGDPLRRVLDEHGTDRGLLVVGETDAEAAPLLAFADLLGWPVIAEVHSNARAGRAVISTYHHLLSDRGFAAAHRPQVVVRVGRVGLSKALLAFLDPDVPQVLLDHDGAWLDPGRSVSAVLRVDPAAACDAFVADRRGDAPVRGQWLASWLDAEARARSVVDAILDGEDAPSEPRTARDLAAALPDGAALVVASSMPVRDLDMFMRPRAGLRVLANRGASGIDGFVSTAFGVALAHPGPVAALSGDLSLLHDQNGLLLADRPDLVLVVVNNDGGGIFSFLPQAQLPDAFERLFATPHGIEIGALAALHRCGHTRVEHAVDLAGAVRAAHEAGGVHIVEVRTDRERNVALHRRITAAVAAQL